MSEKNEQIYEFGAYRLNVGERILKRGGEIVSLAPKVFDLLALLVENHGHLLEKDEIIKRLWADSFVEEANLNVNVSALRRALGDTATEQRFIETVPKRGYRFVAEVSVTAEEITSLPKIKTSPTEESENEQKVIVEEAGEPKFLSDKISEPTAPAPRPKARQKISKNVLLASSVGTLLISTVVFFVWYSSRNPNDKAGANEIKTIAVLPFKPLTKTGGDEALEVGMADALITKLSVLQQITVRPTSAVLKYSGTEVDSLTAGRELQADAVLEGKIQRVENKIRVTVQLLRTSDGATVWSDSFDDFFTNIFAVQDSISEKMVEKISVRLTKDEQQILAKRYTEDTEAYRLYLQGRYFHEQISREGSIKALEFYQAAVEKDPEYALAYAQMTGAFAHLVNLNIDREANLQKAREAARKAVALDPNLAEARESLAVIKDAFEWNWAEAETEYRKAIELNPKSADAHFAYSIFLSRFKRHDEAIREIETAKQINPVAMYIQNQATQTLIRARRYPEAVEQARRAIELKPDNPLAHAQIVRLYVYQSMPEEAEKALQKYLEFKLPGQEATIALVYLQAGRKSEGEKILRELIGKYKEADNCYNYAIYYARLGDKDRAFEFLEKAYQRRETPVITLNVDPEWNALHSDPRFQDLVRRTGLPL